LDLPPIGPPTKIVIPIKKPDTNNKRPRVENNRAALEKELKERLAKIKKKIEMQTQSATADKQKPQQEHVIPTVKQVLKLEETQEELNAFQNAKRVLSLVSLARQKDVLEQIAMSEFFREIALATVLGQARGLMDRLLEAYFTPNQVEHAYIKLASKRKELPKELNELLPLKEFKLFMVVALLRCYIGNTKPGKVKEVIKQLRNSAK